MAEQSSGRVLRGKAHEKGVEAGKLVETANSLEVEDFFQKYFTGPTRATLNTLANTLELEVDLKNAATLSRKLLDGCMSLVEQTSRDDYAKSEMGWKPSAKRKEMLLLDMKYMILRTKIENEPARDSPSVLGFVSFMVTYEDGFEVIYLYEIHLAPSIQGKGLGKALLGVVEGISHQLGVSKLMLTVFRSNEHAHGWYSGQGFEVDEFSPSPKVLRNGTVKESGYLILSKRFGRTV